MRPVNMYGFDAVLLPSLAIRHARWCDNPDKLRDALGLDRAGDGRDYLRVSDPDAAEWFETNMLKTRGSLAFGLWQEGYERLPDWYIDRQQDYAALFAAIGARLRDFYERVEALDYAHARAKRRMTYRAMDDLRHFRPSTYADDRKKELADYAAAKAALEAEYMTIPGAVALPAEDEQDGK